MKLFRIILAFFGVLPAAVFGAGQAVTVQNSGTGIGTFNTAQITSYIIGQPVTFTGGTTFNPLPIQASVTTIALLRSYPVVPPVVNGSAIQVTGYYAPNDGGGGVYVWNSTSTATDDGGTIIKATGVTTGRWLLQYAGPINVRTMGAYGDGTHDDSAAIQAALNLHVGVVLPAGHFHTATALTVSSYDRISGVNVGESFIEPSDGINAFTVTGLQIGWVIEGFTINYGPATGNTKSSNVASIAIKTVSTNASTYPYLFTIKNVDIYYAYQGIVIGDYSFMYALDRVRIQSTKREGLRINEPTGGTTVILKNVYCNDTGGWYMNGVNSMSIIACAVDNSTDASANGGVIYFQSCAGVISGFDFEANTFSSNGAGLVTFTSCIITASGVNSYNNALTAAGGQEVYVLKASGANGLVTLMGSKFTDTYTGTGTVYTIVTNSGTAIVVQNCSYSAPTGGSGTANADNSATYTYCKLGNTITSGKYTFSDYCNVQVGNGSPNSAITDNVGGIYLRLDGAGGSILYAKETGAYSNTGWDAAATVSSAGVLNFGATIADGAAAQTGTLTNAPAAGNPTKWLKINDNGTTRYVPAW